MSSSHWEPGTGRQLKRVYPVAYRIRPQDTPLSREVSRFPLPASRALTWWQFGLLSLAPLAFGVTAYAVAMAVR